MSSRSEQATSKDFTPSELDVNADWLFEQINMIRAHERNKIIEGVDVEDPTTPSDQATGTGNTTWNLNLKGGKAIVGGAYAVLADADDTAVHSGSNLLPAVGRACVASVVIKNDGGALSFVVVKGAVALTADAKAPLPGAIDTACGGKPWIKVGDSKLTRTGDLTVTQEHDNSLRPLLSVTVDTNFGDLTVL